MTVLGTSMGGYAALLFGNLVGAERVIAFDPQTLIDKASRQRYNDTRWAKDFETIVDGPYSDLAGILNGTTENYLLFGQDIDLDGIAAFHLAQSPASKAALFGFEYSGHNVSQQLKRIGALDHCITALAQGDVSYVEKLADIAFFAGAADIPALLDLFAKMRTGQPYDALLNQLYAKFPKWAYGAFLVGRQRQADDQEAAVGYFERAVRLKPHFPEALFSLGRLLLQLGRPREALPHLAGACQHSPRRAAAHFYYAVCLEELAKHHLQTAVSLSPNWDAATKRLEKLTRRSPQPAQQPVPPEAEPAAEPEPEAVPQPPQVLKPAQAPEPVSKPAPKPKRRRGAGTDLAPGQ